MATQAERLARLETDFEWIKSGLESVQDNQKEGHDKLDSLVTGLATLQTAMDVHMTNPAGEALTNGLSIHIGRKTLVTVLGLPLIGGGAGAIAWLEKTGSERTQLQL